MLGIVTVVIFIACAQGSPSGVDSWNEQPLTRQRFDIEGRIAKDGYYSESHDVTTSDGYILEINRIPFSRFETKDRPKEPRPVVFLMHGLQNSALAFIFLGPEFSIAYTLADAGYDVWMGNARGVVNSRRHVSLDPDKPSDRQKFFDYTFEDIGEKDLPAMLDYILKYTNQKQLNYIGHSQGGTAFLVLNSRRPEYNRIFASAHLLAGVGYQTYFPCRGLKAAAQRTDSIYAFAVRLGSIEIGPSRSSNKYYDIDSCNNPDLELDNTQDFENYVKPAVEEVKNDLPLEILAGSSIKQFAHYGQNIRDEQFRRWNYGPLGNLFAYGRLAPPAYDLRLINVDVTMHYTVADVLLDKRDVLNMAEAMPNTKVRRVARDSFRHTDFVIASDSRTLVTDYIVEELNKKNK